MTRPHDAVERLDLSERLAIHELAARYGTLVDDRDWEGFASLFTVDATFLIVGRDPVVGLAAIKDFMRQASHPVSHHVTNVFVEADAEGVSMRSKVIATLPKARAASADYRDRLARTADGWRIAERIVTLRPEPA